MTNIRRPALLRPLVIATAAVFAFLAVATAGADANTYCVNKTDPSCFVPHFDNNLQGALDAAASNNGLDTVLIGPGTQTRATGFAYNDPSDPVEIVGSGASQTELTFTTTTGSAIGLYVSASAGTEIRDLSLRIPTNDFTTADYGIDAGQFADIKGVKVVGPNANNVKGIRTGGGNIDDSVVDLPASAQGNRAIESSSGFPVISDSVIKADQGVVHSDPATTTTIVRCRITANQGAVADGGKFVISNSLIKLNSVDGAGGVEITNDNNGSSTMSADLDGVTIVGDPMSSNTKGIKAKADLLAETTNLNVTNTLITGTEFPLHLVATSGRTTTATIDHSAFDKSAIFQNGVGGTLNYTEGPGNIDLAGDPGFKNPAGGDYTPTVVSPLIDVGDPADPGAGVTDITDINRRACHGTSAGIIRRDIGAFEFKTDPNDDCVAPDTSITGGPGPTTEIPAPGFTLASNDGLATWLCSVDGAPFTGCPTLYTAPDLGLGPHKLSVKAIDVYGNVDQTPATYDYTVVQKIVPPTCQTDKSLCPPEGDTTAPRVLRLKVPKKTKKKRVKVTFKSNEANVTFTCQLNKKKPKRCKSPWKTPKLKKGVNTVTVTATDKAGNVSKPAKAKIKRKK